MLRNVKPENSSISVYRIGAYLQGTYYPCVAERRAVLPEAPDLTEADMRDALSRLDPLWDELFPAEQERIVRLLVERVVVSEAGAEITLKLDGIAGLARDLMSRSPELRRAA